MQPIPLSLMTLYADLVQSMDIGAAVSVSTKVITGIRYLYASEREGMVWKQRLVGREGDPEAEAEAARVRSANSQNRQRQTTVRALKAMGLPGPSIQLGRVMQAVADAGLFKRGIVLVGTGAYTTYAPLVGAFLPAQAMMTGDADLSVAKLAATTDTAGEGLLSVLRNADKSFAPVRENDDSASPHRFTADDKFMVEVLTPPRRGKGLRTVPVPALGCSAVPLPFMDFLIEDSVETVALYRGGVQVRVPAPERYAVHKLIIAQRRDKRSAKKPKDLMQAKALIEALHVSDPGAIEAALSAARAKGKAWRETIAKSIGALWPDTLEGAAWLSLSSDSREIVEK